jgi:hypothetical protein
MADTPLAQRVIEHLTANPVNNISLWSLANALYDNCMSKSQAGNGARVANLRRCAERSERLGYYPCKNGEGKVFLIPPTD